MSTQKVVRVGFIGAGWTERVQIPMFRRGGLVAQAISSGNPANAQRVAQQLTIPEVYPDWRALIASPTVDVVSIVTPPHLHAEMAIAALQAGKHVICENQWRSMSPKPKRCWPLPKRRPINSPLLTTNSAFTHNEFTCVGCYAKVMWAS